MPPFSCPLLDRTCRNTSPADWLDTEKALSGLVCTECLFVYQQERQGARGAPVSHAAGDGEDGVKAAKEDAVQQHLADARRQRQRGQMAAQHRQPLPGRLKRADVLQQLHRIRHRDGRRRLHCLVQKLCNACVIEAGTLQQLHL